MRRIFAVDGKINMTHITLAALLAFTLAVTGCGGGSGSLGSGEATRLDPMIREAEVESAELSESAVSQADTGIDEDAEDAVIEEDALAEERQQVEQAIAEAEIGAAVTEPSFDTAVQEASLRIADSYTPYRTDSGHAEFDGEELRVFLPLYVRGYPVVLNSALHEVDDTAVPSRVAGYSQRTRTLFNNGPLAVVSVRWNDGDDSDYLAAGWWVHDAYGGSDLEAGAIFDGPELRGALPDSLSLPLTGQAVYHGEAAGLYQTQTRVHCTAFPCDIPGLDDVAGEFAAEAKLVANFSRGDIEGCVGCRRGIRFTPATYDLGSGDVERGAAATRDYLFWLHRTGFLESPHTKGAFAGSLTVIPLGAAAAGYGFWQGRFSNLADSAGSPRLLGATLQGQFEDASTATRFTGVLTAESEAYGESP